MLKYFRKLEKQLASMRIPYGASLCPTSHSLCSTSHSTPCLWPGKAWEKWNFKIDLFSYMKTVYLWENYTWILIFFFPKINLFFERRRDSKRKTAIPSASSLPEYPQQTGPGQAHSRRGKLVQVSHSGSRDPSVRAIPCCFQGHEQEAVPSYWVRIGRTRTEAG